MQFVQRLNERDLKMIALDRNLQEPLKLAVRKRLTDATKEMIRMLSADDKLAEIKRLYYQTSRATIKAGLCQGDRPAEIDVERRRTGTSRGVHGRPVADAIGLGEAGEKRDAKMKNEKVKNE